MIAAYWRPAVRAALLSAFWALLLSYFSGAVLTSMVEGARLPRKSATKSSDEAGLPPQAVLALFAWLARLLKFSSLAKYVRMKFCVSNKWLRVTTFRLSLVPGISWRSTMFIGVVNCASSVATAKIFLKKPITRLKLEITSG